MTWHIFGALSLDILVEILSILVLLYYSDTALSCGHVAIIKMCVS
jgi:hypothetical protein